MIRSAHAATFALTAILCLALGAAPAMADSKCKDVRIKVINQFKDGSNPVKIKVLAVNYFDNTDKKWRDNDLKNTDIKHGSDDIIIEDLEYVEGEALTKFQVKFKFEEDKGWSSEKWSQVVFVSGSCVKGRLVTVTVTDTASKK
jgi:hypothetical protein